MVSTSSGEMSHHHKQLSKAQQLQQLTDACRQLLLQQLGEESPLNKLKADELVQTAFRMAGEGEGHLLQRPRRGGSQRWMHAHAWALLQQAGAGVCNIYVWLPTLWPVQRSTAVAAQITQNSFNQF